MRFVIFLLFFMILGCQSTPQTPEEIHKEVLTLDTHIDFNTKDFQKHRNYGQDLNTQVNLIKMEKGQLDAGFFIVYTGQSPLSPQSYKKSYKIAKAKFKAIHDMTQTLLPDQIGLATSPTQVHQLHKNGKKVAMIGVENAFPLGPKMEHLDEFHQLGARYISITHNGHNQFGDSNVGKSWDGKPPHNGLSPLGEKLVQRCNELGIMIDISHASQKTAQEVMKLSKVPVIASHSSVMGVYKHPRNLSDKTLLALQKNKGVVQIVAFRSYVKKPSPELLKKYHKLSEKFGLPKGNVWNSNNEIWNALARKPKKVRTAYYSELKAIDRKYDFTSVSDVVDHIDYAVKKIGIDHVGISSDFGGGGGVHGWENASQTWNVTRELIKRGYNKEDIRKLWGGNLLRVWENVEKYSQKKS